MGFDQICVKMILALSCFKIKLKKNLSRWPPGAVTKISINTKMTISQEPLVEIDPSLYQNVSWIKPF